MRRKTTHTNDSLAEQRPKKKLDQKRKLDIIGLLMIVFAILLFLALVSHSSADESVADLGLGDLIRLFGGDPDIQARADITRNWLGLSGALIASFFLNITVGYFSLAFPVLLGFWGWFILRKRDLRTLAYYTNSSLVFVFFAATFFGLLRLVPWLPVLSPTWSGNIGDFTAGLLSRFIGTTGGVILIIATIIVLAIVVVDYDIHKTLDRLKQYAIGFSELFRHGSPEKVSAIAKESQMPSTALDVPPLAAEGTPPVVIPIPRAPKKKETEPQPSAEEFAALIRPPVSIARAERQPVQDFRLSTESHSPMERSLRSNGVIPKESVDELRAAMMDAKQDILPLSAHEEEVTVSIAEQAQPDSILNEHEKKAVQAAVAKKVALAESGLDSETANSGMASDSLAGYKLPTVDLLDHAPSSHVVSDAELRQKAEQVVEKLSVFGIAIKDISVIPGPVVTQFELVPDSSVKISKIVSLADDLALALAARGIRIIAPIPGKSAVGVEIPNNSPEIVNFRSVVSSAIFQKARHHLPLGMGKSITGDVYTDDLARMPHLLIAGATGSGKSVGINVMICSVLFKLHPSDVKFVMIDPKKIELQQYRGLSRHFLARCPDIDEEIITDPANAVIALKCLELEMDMRYTKLAKAGVRHVSDYNAKIRSGTLHDTESMRHYRLPYVIVIIDELADLMITAAREVEEPIARLAQLARAVGIHLIVATQRPSVDVITGVIKANFSARIAYQVASRIDSRTILDSTGADQLLGNGDMLYQPSGQPKPVRIQNAFLSTAEVERIVDFIGDQHGYVRPYQLPSVKVARKGQTRDDGGDVDELLHEAAHMIVRHQHGSVSLLQRRLKIGYSRAARIIDQLEAVGVVGPSDGSSKAREVLIDDESLLDDILLQA